MSAPRTLFEKLWDRHVVRAETPDTPAVLYVDLHLVHEVTSAQAFAELRERGLRVRRPDRTIATMDHSTPTHPRAAHVRSLATLPVIADDARAQLVRLADNCDEFDVPLIPL